MRSALTIVLATALATGCAKVQEPRPMQPIDRVAFAEFLGPDWDSPRPGAKLSGSVRDGVDGRPIAGALVELWLNAPEGSRWEQRTSEGGFYKFDGLPGGDYTIKVSIGEAQRIKFFQLPQDAAFRVNFLLYPPAPQ